MAARLLLDPPTRSFPLGRQRQIGIPRERSLKKVQSLQNQAALVGTEKAVPRGEEKIIPTLVKAAPAPTKKEARFGCGWVWSWTLQLAVVLLGLVIAMHVKSQEKRSITLSQRLAAAEDNIGDINNSVRNWSQATAARQPLYALKNAFSENIRVIDDLGFNLGRNLTPKFKSALKGGNCRRVQLVLSSAQTSARQSAAALHRSSTIFNDTMIHLKAAYDIAQEVLAESLNSVAVVTDNLMADRSQKRLDELAKIHNKAEEWLTVVCVVMEKIEPMKIIPELEIERFDQFTAGLQTLIEMADRGNQIVADGRNVVDLDCGRDTTAVLDRLFLGYTKRLIENDLEAAAFSDYYASL
jgi:hypothetical protein